MEIVIVLLIIGAICVFWSVFDVILGGDMVEIGALGLVLIFFAFVLDVILRSF